jgi:leucyl aminopeptidase
MKHLTTIFLMSVAATSLSLTSTATAKTDSTSDQNPSQSEQTVWITLGADAAETVQNKFKTDIPMTLSGIVGKNSANPVAIAQIPESKVIELSQLMHDEHKRCGGFFYHSTQQQAQEHAHQIHQTQNFATVNYSIDNPQAVNALISNVSSADLTATVNSLTSYYNRYYTSSTGVDSANWIKNHWQSIAADRNDIDVKLYGHNSWNQPSVIATITGTTYPDEIVIIGGHLDSINSYNRSGRAPGADDNASGIAVLTGSLEAIVESGFKPERTVKIMGYAAEEVGLRGSQEIAAAHKNNNANVLGVVQFDMSGYKGSSQDIVFITDYTNQQQNQFLADLVDTYLPSISYGYDRCGYGCSDHASWHNQGFAASMPFESYMGSTNGNIHTANDNYFDASHSVNFAKLSVAFLAELAKGTVDGDTPPPPPPGDKVLKNGVPVTDLSATTGNDILYTMEVPAGATNIRFAINGGSGDADLYVRKGASPTDSTYDCRPYRNGNNESCSGSGEGTYYVRLKAYSSFSGVTLTGSFVDNTGPGTPAIDETYNNVSVDKNAWTRYTQDLDGDYSLLLVTISGGSGDADLYLRHGSEPTTSSYDCRPYKWGNEESCTINAPQSGTWHIGLRGYSATSGVTLTIQATPQ